MRKIFTSNNLTYFGIFLIMLFFFTNVSLASAPSPRLDQLVKNARIGEGGKKTQTISCSDINGSINNISLAYTGGGLHSYVVFFRNDELYTDLIPQTLRKSNEAHLSSPLFQQAEHTFTFPTPLDIDNDLCAGANSFSFRVVDVQYLFGSLNDEYLGGFYSERFVAPRIQDLYFIINGVAEINHPPILDYIGTQNITEGHFFSLSLSGSDQDQHTGLNYGVDVLPENSLINGSTLYWLPSYNSPSTISLDIFAEDGGNVNLPPERTYESVEFQIEQSSPQFEYLDQLVKNARIGEGGKKTQTISCSDINGSINNISLAYTGGGLHSYVVFFRNDELYTDLIPQTLRKSNEAHLSSPLFQQAEHTFTFPTPLDIDNDLCAGANSFSFRVVDVQYLFGSLNDEYLGGFYSERFVAPRIQDLYFIINQNSAQNGAPVLDLIAHQTTLEGSNLSFTVSATDPDNDPLTYSLGNLPLGATFNPDTGEFSWTPNYNEAGTYTVTFTVSDGVLTDTATTTIEVLNANRAPILTPIGNQTVSENQNLSFMLSASDPDGNTLTYSALNLPLGATFNPTTQTFSWTPGYVDAGNYENIEFTVSDNGSPMELDVELITITVGDVNRAPEISNPGPQEVLEEEPLSFSISAVDPDNDTITLSVSSLPTGATFNTTNGTFSWTPTLAQEGIYTITITATDNGTPIENTTVDVVITVGDNPTPIEQADDLIEDVILLDLPHNIENSYMANLQKVGTFITNGQIQPAINQLNSFINKVNQDYAQGKITQQVRDALVGTAQALIGDLE